MKNEKRPLTPLLVRRQDKIFFRSATKNYYSILNLYEMKKDFSPGSNPECHTLGKAIHERIAHSSVWPRCECPWSAQYSDGFHGRRLSGTNRPPLFRFRSITSSLSLIPFYLSSSDVRTFCWISELAFSCPKKPSRLIRRKSESEKDGLLSIENR